MNGRRSWISTALRNDSAVPGGTCFVPLPLTRHVFLSANAPRKCTGLFSFAPGGAGGILRQDSKTALRLNDSAVPGGTCLVPLPLTRHVFLSANAPRKCTGLFSFAPGGAGGILRRDSKTALRLNDSAVPDGTCLVPLPMTRHVFLSAGAPRKCTGLFSFAPGGAGGILRRDSKTALRLNDSAVPDGTCLVALPMTRHVFLSARTRLGNVPGYSHSRLAALVGSYGRIQKPHSD